ncbi:MAG: hypothetical protein NZ874_02495 [Fimbriimonadales bacterium]|nr:hypothetical protein [Fimbriimonadales bacterium]
MRILGRCGRVDLSSRVLAGAAALTVLISRPCVASSDPWESKPLIFSYLMRTEISEPRSTEIYECARRELYAVLGLTEAEIEKLNAIAEQEYLAFVMLKSGDMEGAVPTQRELPAPAIPAQLLAPLNEYAVGKIDWQSAVELIHAATDSSLAQLLGERYLKFREWIRSWWPEHQERIRLWLEGQASDFETAADAQSVYVFATQYIPNGGSRVREVALPDRYVKFANLGWCSSIPSAYARYYRCRAGYTVDLNRGNRNATRVRVDEVGPWNVDDNYWDNYPNLNSGAPRRLPAEFADDYSRVRPLRLREPESSAAFYEGYNSPVIQNNRAICTQVPPRRNDGRDQFCRRVTNPAGIDLSPAVAEELGLRYLENAWITVNTSRLP